MIHEVITTGLDLLMPLIRVRINTRDAPRMSSQLNSEAFKEHGTDSVQFKFYRNAVNRKRKLCKANFYETKVEQMKQSDPKSWWKEVYRLSGARHSSSCSLLPHLDVDELESLPMHEVADHINHALLEPLEEYRLIDEIPKIPLQEGPRPRIPSCDRAERLQETFPSQSCAPMGFLIVY